MVLYLLKITMNYKKNQINTTTRELLTKYNLMDTFLKTDTETKHK